MKRLSTIVTVLLGIGLGVLISYALIAQAETIVYQAPIIEIENKTEPEPKEVRIQILYSKDEVLKKIREAFLDAPIMLEVARCESQYKVTAHNTTLNKDGTTDGGIFQINSVHDEELAILGLDKWDPEDNIKFARILYDRRGLNPWNSSRGCWGKYLGNL